MNRLNKSAQEVEKLQEKGLVDDLIDLILGDKRKGDRYSRKYDLILCIKELKKLKT